ncbi:hypothetical protein Fcan01_10211 [Folsomia candida]|uniref:Uncharacterized protein n=1 Tax=Folsomia candida TaxID=158441 RepID=A0A226ED26_FOLCA|nr:hypothetical protein Fcan01_10211 [Folsomia candida]
MGQCCGDDVTHDFTEIELNLFKQVLVATDEMDEVEIHERKPNSKEDGDESETIPVSGRKRQFRWNSERDLTMVTEIEKVQPFSDSPKESVKLWSAVAETLNTTAPTGKEEELSELDTKLSSLSPLVRDLEDIIINSKEKKKQKLEVNKEKAEEIRGAAMSTVKKNDDLGTPPSAQQFTRKLKRTGDGDLVELWKEKQEQDNQKFKAEQDIKVEELQLKNATLQFEKEKFEHQRQLDLERLQIEKAKHDSDQEERRLQLETQKLMLELLMKK